MNRYSQERLAEVGRFLNLHISKEKELQEIVELAAEICDSEIAMITLMNEETQFVKFISGAKIDQVEYTNTFCQHTLKQNDLLVIEDAFKDDRVSGNPFVYGDPHLRFYAGMPLTSEKGNAIGTLCVFDLDTKSLSALQQLMLRSLAEQVTRLMEFDMTLEILKEQYEQSRASATTLLTYFQSSSSCHLLMDKTMHAMAYNQAMTDLVFANHQIYLKEGMDVTEYIHPAFLELFIQYFNRALNSEVVTAEQQLSYENGTICWAMTYESALNAEGEQIGVSFNATDITRSTTNQQQIDQQVDAISKINEMQANELMAPIEKIYQETEKIGQLTVITSIEEFRQLQLAVAELLEKKEKIIAIKDIN